jgi:hypothetical protein
MADSKASERRDKDDASRTAGRTRQGATDLRWMLNTLFQKENGWTESRRRSEDLQRQNLE